MELDYKRIVVTFLMHLGDVILTTPFLEVLRKAAPHSHITYVIDEKLQQVMQYNPNIDELIVVDKKGRHNNPCQGQLVWQIHLISSLSW